MNTPSAIPPVLVFDALERLHPLVPKKKHVIALAGPRTMRGLRAALSHQDSHIMVQGVPVVEMPCEGFAVTSLDYFLSEE